MSNESIYIERVIRSICIEQDMEVYWTVNPDGELRAFLNCSDTFYWATADGEDLTPELLPGFLEACSTYTDKYGQAEWWVPILWIAQQRNQRPMAVFWQRHHTHQGGCYYIDDERFQTAMAALPERTDSTALYQELPS